MSQTEGDQTVGGRLIDGLHKVLNLSSEVRRPEVVGVLLFLSNLFLVLVAYYVLKTVREPLILASGGAEMKSYAAGFQAGLLIGFIPAYGWVTRRVPRMWLNVGLTLFFVGCIELFFLAGYFGWPNLFGLVGGSSPPAWLAWAAGNLTLGFAFFVWVGIFSLSMIAQFWSYANDLYDEPTGKRLFPVIAIGATAGAPLGSAIAARLFDAGVGPYLMMQVSAGLLLVHLALYVLIERHVYGESAPGETGESTVDRPGRDVGGFKLIARNRYLWWLALFFILLNLVNTTGEYILSVYVEDAAHAAVEAGRAASLEAFIGRFYGDFFSVVNVAAVLIQAFLVSRLLKWFGMKGVLFALPIVAFGTYGLVAFGVGLPVYRWAKTAENSTDYSVMNTTRALVWLPTTRAEQYAAKQTVDTFFVRLGDVLSAGLVFLGTTWLQFGPGSFAVTNLVLIGCWIGVGVLVLRHFWRLSEERDITTEDLLEETG